MRTREDWIIAAKLAQLEMSLDYLFQMLLAERVIAPSQITAIAEYVAADAREIDAFPHEMRERLKQGMTQWRRRVLQERPERKLTLIRGGLDGAGSN